MSKVICPTCGKEIKITSLDKRVTGLYCTKCFNYIDLYGTEHIQY